MENENNELIVEGYRFKTPEDATKARDEIKKVSYIRSKLNYDEPGSVLKIYEKMLSKDVLSTPVGYVFLREVRSYLLDNGVDPQMVGQLPPFAEYSLGSERVRKDPRPRIVPAKPKLEYHKRFIASVIVNVILLAVIITMVIMTVKSPNPNILNYEYAVQDKYAAWEQDLSKREKEVRLKEKELGINLEKGDASGEDTEDPQGTKSAESAE